MVWKVSQMLGKNLTLTVCSKHLAAAIFVHLAAAIFVHPVWNGASTPFSAVWPGFMAGLKLHVGNKVMSVYGRADVFLVRHRNQEVCMLYSSVCGSVLWVEMLQWNKPEISTISIFPLVTSHSPNSNPDPIRCHLGLATPLEHYCYEMVVAPWKEKASKISSREVVLFAMAWTCSQCVWYEDVYLDKECCGSRKTISERGELRGISPSGFCEAQWPWFQVHLILFWERSTCDVISDKCTTSCHGDVAGQPLKG